MGNSAWDRKGWTRLSERRKKSASREGYEMLGGHR